MSTPASETPGSEKQPPEGVLPPGGGTARVPGVAARRPRPSGALSTAVRRGDPYVWLTGSALGVSLLMIAGLVAVILANGLGFFWPRPVEKLTLQDGSVVQGEVVNREAIPNPGAPEAPEVHRIQLRVGNRDLLGYDFQWVDEAEIASRETPEDVFVVERREYGPLIGTPSLLKRGEQVVAEGPEAAWAALEPLIDEAEDDREIGRASCRERV